MMAMRTRLAVLFLCAALPVSAETDDTGVDQGFSLLEQGARIIMRSLLDDIEPELGQMRDGLQDAMGAIKPQLRDLARMIDEIDAYEAPQKLPNGDIILRRKRTVPDHLFGPNGETET